MKKYIKSIALFLSLLMLFNCFSIISFAEENETQVDNPITAPTEEPVKEWHLVDEQEFTTGELIGEVEELTSLREENIKHFRLSDGTYEAVVYTEPIHRKDENGVWQDIDNTIELKTDANISKYTTQDSRVSFADRFKADSDLFTLSENGYSISMQLLNGGNEIDNEIGTTDFVAFDTPTVNNSPSERTETKFNSLEEAKSINNTSSIVYNNIKKNTNIEYILNGNNVKENIIITAPCESYEYIFQITLDGLYAELDGNVIFIKDIETNQTEYTIPAPYMYDANGNYSYDVSYTLEQVKDEIYLLVIEADAEWINSEERAFPVVVDPTVNTTYEGQDSYVNSSSPNTNYGSDARLWVSDLRTTYIKIDLPPLPDGATINTAFLYIPYYFSGSTGRMKTGAYRVLSNWAEHSITYNNAPTLGSYISYATLSASTSITQTTPGTARYSIHSVVREWYAGTSENYGVAIKREASDTATNSAVMFKSHEADYEEFSYISINYTYTLPSGVYAFENANLNDYWISVKDDDCLAGNLMQYEQSAIDPTDSDVFDRSRLFKVTQIGTLQRYTIRSMLNNNLSFNIVGDKIVTKEIPSVDAEVPIADTFYIQWNGDGFTIEPYNSSYILSITSFSSADLSYESDTSDSPEARWLFREYTGQDKRGFMLFRPSSWRSTGIVVGTTDTATLIGWSTYEKANTLSMEIDSEFEDLATLLWDSSNNQLTLTALSPGRIKFRGQIKHEDGTLMYTGNYEYMIVPQEGTYYIQNVSTDKYVDIEGPSKNSGAIIQQWQYHSGKQEKWNIEHVSDSNGYVRLRSVYSNLYIGVDSTNTASIKQYSTQSDYTLWKIDRTATGNLVFKCKATESSGLVLSVPFTANSNGTDLTQVSYVDDENTRDEWWLTAYKTTLYGVSNSGHDHSSCLETVKNILQNDTFNNVILKTGALSSSECLLDLKNTNIFTSRSHGTIVVWTGTTTAASTGIILNDKGGTEKIALYSHLWGNMTSGSTSIATTDSFEGLDIALFIGCETAYDGVAGRNLPAVVSNQDAEVAIGFSDSINCNAANGWTEDFYMYLLEGHTVQESVDFASCNQSVSSGLQRAVICGNGNLRIK